MGKNFRKTFQEEIKQMLTTFLKILSKLKNWVTLTLS